MEQRRELWAQGKLFKIGEIKVCLLGDDNFAKEKQKFGNTVPVMSWCKTMVGLILKAEYFEADLKVVDLVVRACES